MFIETVGKYLNNIVNSSFFFFLANLIDLAQVTRTYKHGQNGPFSGHSKRHSFFLLFYEV